MAEAKQPQLNGAFYGPAIPPTQTYHRPSRGRGCGPCCLLTTLIKIMALLAIIVGIVILVSWLVLRPSRPKYYVQSASLAQFNLTDRNILHYNLTVHFAARNPNKKIGIYYDKLEPRAYYEGERFAWVALPGFYQGHKNTTTFTAVFTGSPAMVALGGSGVAEFTKEKAEGFFDIDVKIYARMRFKVGSAKSRRFTSGIECELRRVPLATTGSSVGGFSGTKCDFDL